MLNLDLNTTSFVFCSLISFLLHMPICWQSVSSWTFLYVCGDDAPHFFELFRYIASNKNFIFGGSCKCYLDTIIFAWSGLLVCSLIWWQGSISFLTLQHWLLLVERFYTNYDLQANWSHLPIPPLYSRYSVNSFLVMLVIYFAVVTPPLCAAPTR